MPGNTASLTFKLFGVDINASRTISGVGVAAAGTAHDLEILSKGTLAFTAIAGAAGIASVGLAGALGVGLGAAFAGVGVAAALMNKHVKSELETLGKGIKSQISAAAKPVQDAMLQLFKYISQSVKTMAPLFRSFFAAVAPLVTIIGHGLVNAVVGLVDQFTPLVKIVTPIVQELFSQLPDLIGNVAYALKEILSPLSGNTAAFGMLLQTISGLLPIVGSIIGSLVRLGQQIMPAFHEAILTVGTALNSGLMKVLPIVGKAIQVMLPPIRQLIDALLGIAAQILPVLLPPLSKLVGLLAGALAKVLPTLLPPFLQLIGIFGGLVKAVEPIIPPLVALALWVSKAVSNIIPPLAALVAAIVVALLPAIKGLLPVLLQVANQVGGALADAFKQATPSLVLLARAVSQILIALTPLIPVIVQTALAFLPLIPAVAQLAASLATALVPAMRFLGDHAKVVGPALLYAAIALKGWSVGAGLASSATTAFSVAQKVLAELCLGTRIQLVALWVQTAAIAVAQKVAAVASKAWAAAQWLLNVALSANPIGLVIVALVALAAGLVYAWKHSETFRNIVKGTWAAIEHAAGNLVHAVLNMRDFFVKAWQDIREWVLKTWHGINDAWHAIVAAAHWLAAQVVRAAKDGFLGPLPLILSRWGQLVQWFRELPGRIKNALGGLGHLLTQAGRDVIRGLWDGLLAVWHNVTHWISGLGGWIKAHKGPMSLDRNLLYDAGHAIMTGFWRGLKDGGLKAFGFIKAVAGQIAGGFSGQGLRFTGGPIVALARNMAAQMGWVGQQWNALYQIVAHESGWNPQAQNPTSTAYGLFQFLNSTWGMTGFAKTSDPARQIAAGLNYIRRAYGSPANAWAFWQAHHWYGSGLEPTVFSRPTLIGVGEAGPEVVSVTRGRGGGGGATYVFNFHGPVYGDRQALIREVRDGLKRARRLEGRDPATV